MKMIEKMIRAMQDTGLIEGMSLEDADSLATAALEALREPTQYMVVAGGNMRIFPSVYMGCPPEQAKRDAIRVYDSMIDAALNE